MATNTELYHELSFYTLSHADVGFIHQHAVDAQAAQTADENTKAITIVFALVGLYLFVEKNFTGRQVQQAHLKMAANKKQWPEIALPITRGEITVADVLAAAPGRERDKKIEDWCKAVWESYQNNRLAIVNLADEFRLV